MTAIEEKRETAKKMHDVAFQDLKDAVAEVFAEFDRTGETFPYMLDGKVVHLTMAQLQTLKEQSSSLKAERLDNIKGETKLNR